MPLSADWKESIRKQVEKKVDEEAVRVATIARDKLTEKFRSLIDDFYGEYDPKYYYRHGGSGYYSDGLHKSYKKYYKNSHGVGGSKYGGIEISAEFMDQDYDTSSSQVLLSALGGFHGPPFLGINFGLNPAYSIIKYRNELVNELCNMKVVK